MYEGVPMIIPRSAGSPSPIRRATPRSISVTRGRSPSCDTTTFEDFTSPCTNPAAWIASRPSATCRAISMPSVTDSSARRLARSCPSSHSSARHGRPPSSRPQPKHFTTRGLCTLSSTHASRMRRAALSAVERCSCSRLIATIFPVARSTPLSTSPNAPRDTHAPSS